MFRCDTPAKAIATSLHEICSKVRWVRTQWCVSLSFLAASAGKQVWSGSHTGDVLRLRQSHGASEPQNEDRQLGIAGLVPPPSLQQSSPDRNIPILCLGPLLTSINRVLYFSGDCPINQQLWLF